MKNLKLLTFLLAILAVFAIGCEGPAGQNGADGAPGANGSDGADGVDGNITCLVCHSGDNMDMKQSEFAQSAHSAGAIAVDYAGGRSSCAYCHSHEGFVEWANTGDVAANFSNPSAWECGTCHGLHKTFEEEDYALRADDAVPFIFDAAVTFDAGSSNLCANCHQSRRAEPNVSDPGDTFTITSSHYGPHHGAQSNVLYGAGMAEISGSSSYPAAGGGNHYTMEEARCTGCHMDAWDEDAADEGGHTFAPALASCNDCHGATDENFNYGGVQVETAAKLEQLRDILVGLHVLHYESGDYYELDPETGDIVLVTAPGGYHVVPGTYPMVQAQAFFNWVGLEEDRSLGAHNPKYVKALLANSIEALTP